mmetsp:Transcript_85051/g.268292  ORF Transcript_85051/g.268292 Transcript_85051/m.268292 type:complete len:433 (-) Transcript_85051:168-1466(-)
MAQEAVARRVGRTEQLCQLLSQGPLLAGLLPDHLLCVVRRRLHGISDEERKDDADQGEDDERDVQHEEDAKPGAHLLDQAPGVVRPATAEGHLEHRVKRAEGRAVVPAHPYAYLVLVAAVDNELLQQLGHEERTHHHEDQERHHGPEDGQEAQDHGVCEHAELLEGAHRAYGTQDPSHAEQAHRAKEGHVRDAEFNQRENVQVGGGDDHDAEVEDVERRSEELRPERKHLDKQLEEEEHSENMRGGMEHGVGDEQVHAVAAAQRGLYERLVDLQLREEDRGVDYDQDARGRLEVAAADDPAHAVVEVALGALGLALPELRDEAVAFEGDRAGGPAHAALAAAGVALAALATARAGSGSHGGVLVSAAARSLCHGRGDDPGLATVRVQRRSRCLSRSPDLGGQGALDGHAQLRAVPLQPRRRLGPALLEDLQE